jgi:hypothetical protein
LIEQKLIWSDPTPALVDFGLVRDLSETSLTASWLPRGPGTPLFASPEQLNNEKALIDWRSDQFSIGVILPKKFNIDYYAKIADIYSMLADKVSGTGIRPIMTVCVTLKELENASDALQIASVITRHNPKSVYLVIESEIEPRREIADPNLTSLMVLISAIEKTRCQTIVSYCSSDMVLMKSAGATHCASGNFFNLRRFTRSRFDEQKDKGGKLIAYWFEHNLMAFIRRADIARIVKEWQNGFIRGESSDNIFARQILEQFNAEPKKAWVALGWRQYLAWFSSTEKKLSSSTALTTTSNWLEAAENRWRQISDNEILMDEARNDGSWVRPWRQALVEFKKSGF